MPGIAARTPAPLQADHQRAGLKPWPKVFTNLRASRAIEVAKALARLLKVTGLAIHRPSRWRHYLRTTEDDYAKAVQKAVHNPVQQATNDGRSQRRRRNRMFR